jgi:phosphoribosylformylglycinamidine synthase PurS subunit
MSRVVVEVMPKPEILDPQGKAISQALQRLGHPGLTVRQGKRFEIDVDGDLTEDTMTEISTAAETLLANTVIETFRVRAEGGEPDGTTTDSDARNDAATAGATQSEQTSRAAR